MKLEQLENNVVYLLAEYDFLLKCIKCIKKSLKFVFAKGRGCKTSFKTKPLATVIKAQVLKHAIALKWLHYFQYCIFHFGLIK